jgi:hypothetical protein
LTAGTLNVGTTGAHVMGAGAGAMFSVEGGTLNLAGRLNSANTYVTYAQSGGTVNVCTAGGCLTAPSFGFTGGTGVVTKMSGGTINLVQANIAATPVDYNQTGTMVYTGGVLNIGTAATAGGFTFRAQGQAPAVVVDNTTNNKALVLSGQLNVWGTTTINPATTVNLTSSTTVGQTLLQIGPAVVNNGAIVVSGNAQLRRQPPGTERRLCAELHGNRHVRCGRPPARDTERSERTRRHARPERLGAQRLPRQRVLRANHELGQDHHRSRRRAPHGHSARRYGHPIPGR